MTQTQIAASTVSLAALVALYNELADKPVRGFKDKPTAVARVEKIGTESAMIIVEGPAWAPSADNTAALENEKREQAEKPETQETTPEVVAAKPVKDDAPAKKPAATEDEGPRKRGPAPLHADDHVIAVLSETNPKRKNSASAARFDLYRTGMTVAEYLDAAHALQSDKQAEAYRADLHWDVDKGFISVSPKS